MISPCDVRRPLASAVGVLVLLAGCSRAPEAPSVAGTKSAAPRAHDHAAAAHDHDDHDHDDHGHAARDHHAHGDHEHPQSLREGVEQLATLAAAVNRHLVADARDDADEAVHGMGHLLEDLQGLVRTSSLGSGTKAAATKSLDELFDCFDTLDAALHAEPGKGDTPAEVHASVAKRIEAAIGSLQAAVVSAGTPAASDDDPAAAIIRDAETRGSKEQE